MVELVLVVLVFTVIRHVRERVRALFGVLRPFVQLRLSGQGGQTMAEYGILIAVIAVIVVLAATFLGSNVSSLFKSTGGRL